ncbi:ATP-binding cassette domain-containing protein [Dactylosporangium sp. McL0621]|uniref:ABC transporter ATP-binding protein n=1 Tax=Dactylosporangium sp. McL0621 TaxID=3415678 RepID=UPI003CF0892A
MLARAIEVSRRYGDTLALDRVSLDIPQGGVVGLLGPNGAGKSTLINLLVGLRRPSAGSVELFGGDPRRPENRRRIGVTPQETGLPSTLRVRECVEFVARHFPDSVPTAELLSRFGLTDVAKRQTGGLSGGQKRRLAVALAFAGRPGLVFLDEPTTGLDVQARRDLWNAIREFTEAGNGTVVLTSHYLEEIEALADRVVVVGDGRILADDTVAAIRSMVGIHRVSVSAADLPDLPGVVGVEQADGRTSLLTPDADQLVRDLVHAGVPFHGLQVQPTTLEEAFLTLTSTGR